MARFLHRGHFFALSAWASLEDAEKAMEENKQADKCSNVSCWEYKVCDTYLYL